MKPLSGNKISFDCVYCILEQNRKKKVLVKYVELMPLVGGVGEYMFITILWIFE